MLESTVAHEGNRGVASASAPTRDYLAALRHPDRFIARHIGPDQAQIDAMLELIGARSLDDLIERTVPATIRHRAALRLPEGRSEFGVLTTLREIASGNRVFRSYLGMGYSDCITPPVIQRNMLENPGWYTPYTPYQAEIAQGRLEALLIFQTMTSELTGLPVANASLLDEATACAEAMTMAHQLKGDQTRNVFLVADDCHPQNIDVLRTRAAPLELEVRLQPVANLEIDRRVFGVLLQYPSTTGEIHDFSGIVEGAHQAGALVSVAADILALTRLRPPGEWGADIAVGSAQRFGVPLGYGGPHAAFFATREEFKRHVPGRLIGVSRDARGRPALRLALQTREQHIRREKATSNICTAQALLANIAAMYAVYHGPAGLKQIADRLRLLTAILAAGLERLGARRRTKVFFDTIEIEWENRTARNVAAVAERHGINLRVVSEGVLAIALDETTTPADVEELWQICNDDRPAPFSLESVAATIETEWTEACVRRSPPLRDPIFDRYHSETEMLRYLRRLEARDLSLTTSMIPLGSCTMKLNATMEMLPLTWPEFGRLHPFAPVAQAAGYQRLFRDLQEWLGEITGFTAVSLQPNAGSQGEFAGLLAIEKYHAHQNQRARNVCLIPTSAHGTNPASAVMAGMTVVPVACDAQGNIDVADLARKAEQHRDRLAALMVTYPSTHGVFEPSIKQVCSIIHEFGGQVYLDGANLNAQVGLARPADIGADVCHINLHKTFCIPHGGGGPGMGPICVAAHLAPFLPGHVVVPVAAESTGREQPQGAVSAAPWGSASILTISWVYIAAMGGEGLTWATKVAILNANYVAQRLAPYYPILYRGAHNTVAHECILDLRHFKLVTVEDVAKRLMDYGFHAPTISFPVPGTMMVEPTESESKAELDRFCDALIAIHGEIQTVENGQIDARDNPLKNAPHTADSLVIEPWPHGYSRQQAAFPAPWLYDHKFWPSVARIDNVYGDRNFLCTCAGMEAWTTADPKNSQDH